MLIGMSTCGAISLSGINSKGILQAVLIVVAGKIHPQYCMVTIALTQQEAVVVPYCQSVC